MTYYIKFDGHLFLRTFQICPELYIYFLHSTDTKFYFQTTDIYCKQISRVANLNLITYILRYS